MFVKNNTEHKAFSRTFGCIYVSHIFCMISVLRIVLKKKLPCLKYILTKRITPGTLINDLDRAKDKYTDDEIMDSRLALNVITVFTTYPVFWALYEQQVRTVSRIRALINMDFSDNQTQIHCAQMSRWKLQAKLMNGRSDFLNWTINPDQMHTITPFCALIFLIRFYGTLSPLLAKIGIRKPLQKLTLSGCLATVAFIFSALLQFKILVRASTRLFPLREHYVPSGETCFVIARVNIPCTLKRLVTVRAETILME